MAIQVRDTTRGIRVKPNSRFSRRYCEGWIDCMKAYADRVDEWPFDYGERPLLGFLTAGIWKAGGVCIEEFRADKKAGQAESPDKVRPGRGDLYFHDSKYKGTIEFKMHNVGISQAPDSSKLRKRWSISREDADHGRQWGIPRFGGMFLRPYLGKSRDVDRYQKYLKALIEMTWDLNPEALAWWCPIDEVVEHAKETKYEVAGAILVVKSAR